MCTHVHISSNKNNFYWGRTLDTSFNPFDVDSKVTIVPKNFTLDTQSNPWKTKYAFLGISLSGSTLFFDGVNEKGLAGGLLFLSACTWDKKDNIENKGLIAINSGEIVTWILSNFENVSDIKENISKVAVTSDDIPSLGKLGKGNPVTAHYTFTDKMGNSVVLEPTNNGRFRVFDNNVGVMTNDPTFDWHMTNLGNYIQVKGFNRQQNTLNDKTVIRPISNGTGMLGLPGDYTSPSRFVRAAHLRNFIGEVSDKEAPAQLFSILNSVWVPKRVVRFVENKGDSDFSSYMCAYDQTLGKLYLRVFNHIDTMEFSLENVKENELVTYSVN
ncbi:linear amide C-N hydrolase [Paraclostridium sordellii]|uniref:linear amide C-N hydrolase n=1 Tax=Paraclostridium sordellii TaxID=1505 RepID=UPI001C6154A4|nr:linear amide C-N hydrolase [Paeniclostridium sordellii]QYE99352.1 linear amide C-N hydrolase [Paeniclostridium sordellii]